MASFEDLVGPNWPPAPNCDSLPTLIAAITNIANELANTVASPIKTGMLAGFFVPTELDPLTDGYILCDGRAVSRTTFSALYAQIGDLYGAGDGSITFNVPFVNGRTLMGRNNMGSLAGPMTNPQASVLGGTGGTEFHTLTIAQIPPGDHNAIVGLLGAGTSQFAGGGTQGTAAIALEGGGNPHPNDQPWFALDIYIKT